MIAVDTSTLVAFFEGKRGSDINAATEAMENRILFLPLPVLTELLSDPKIDPSVEEVISQFPILDMTVGFWVRAGKTRSKALLKSRKARLGDALIAQSCLDYKVSLITRDRDFKAFEELCGLSVIW